METTSCDLVVVGLGPGGEHVATEAAKAGLHVVAIDERLVGGECPYYGCIPSKMMIRAADALAEARRVDGLAGTATVKPDWTPVATRIRDEATDDWNDQVAVDRLVDAGAEFVRGHATLDGPGSVLVDGRRFTATKGVLLNTGTAPAVPPIEGIAETPYWTNRDAVRQDTLPASMIVIGGGAIGAELAQAWARFGVEVTVLEVAPRILGPEEPEASVAVGKAFAAEGIDVRAGVNIKRVSYDDGAFTVRVDDDTVTAERLLVAAGRRPHLVDLGLETVGLDPRARSIDTDEHMRAGEKLWAIGDITGKGAFTHMSMYQADIALRDLLDRPGAVADYRAVSRVTFTDPEVGSVGMTQAQARDAGIAVRAATTDLGASTRGWIAQASGLIKLVADEDRGVLIGATVVGPAAGEILGMLTLAVHAEVPVASLASMIYAYPTLHRAVLTAVEELQMTDQPG